LDIANAALEHVSRRGLKKVIQASIAAIPFKSETFDVVFSFEVVTQTPYDAHDAAFREMIRVLKPGGHFFLRVPAFIWLWSSHEEELQVCYRYRLHDLRKKLEQCGFTVEWTSYANGFLFPVILARRLLKRAGIAGGSDVKPLPEGLGWVGGGFKAGLSREAVSLQRGSAFAFGL